MPRWLTVAPHLPRSEREARDRQARDPVARTHWHILWLVAHGHRCPHVAALVGSSVEWGRTVVHRDNTAGPAGVGDRRHANPGAAPRLASEHRHALREAVGGPAPDGGLWTGRKVAAWMSAQLGRPVGEQRGWEEWRRRGFTPQRPRPTRADPDAQAAFKKGGSKPRSRRSERPSRRCGSRLGPRMSTGSACYP